MGEAFTYEDFTPEQLAGLKGEKGEMPKFYRTTHTCDAPVGEYVFIPIESMIPNGASIVTGEMTIAEDGKLYVAVNDGDNGYGYNPSKVVADLKGPRGFPGAVQTVNGVAPDKNGNVQVEAGGVSSWDDMPAPMPGKFFPDGYPYAQMKELLPLTEVVGEGDEFFIAPTIEGMVVGGTYTVNYNGTDYECVCADASVIIPGAVVLGDIDAITGSPSGAYPFVVGIVPPNTAAQMGFGGLVWDLSGASSATVSIFGEAVRKVATKFLPGSIYTVGFDIDLDSGVIVADKEFSEVATMVCNPNVLVRAFLKGTITGLLATCASFTEVNYINGSSIEFTAHVNRYKYNSLTMKSDGTVTLEAVEYSYKT